MLRDPLHGSYFLLGIEEGNPIEDPGIHTGQFRRFSLRELQIATDNFSDKNVLGCGFKAIYKGRLADGSPVAVKRAKYRHAQDAELQFQREVEMISIALHPNLRRLLGFCITPKERLLVYPFMVTRSVASCLRERSESQPPLDWPVRKQIVLGAARGLAYLHDECNRKIIHGDIKSANIFLDEDFEAVVGEFGLAIIGDDNVTHVTTSGTGTIGHIVIWDTCSEKTDVFDYGTFLLELITGQRAFDLARVANDEDMMLLDWVKTTLEERKWEMIVDPDSVGNHMEEGVEQLI
ncbi:hypothetical protein Pfo_026884 [Paulownia fortunei]|nr:hypothetical protein Pfo_026884 [Paulownia fortunei]